MNNEELKKKICKILDNNIRWQPYYYISRGIVYEDDLKNIADDLIAAGIGDVREAEHRVAVVERALKICLIDNLCCWECDLGFDGKCKGTDKEKEKEKCAMLEIDDYIQQAEKELAEERKDEQS